MEWLARMGVAFAELLEAEGRSLRRQIVRLAIALGCGAAFFAVALVGIGILLYGVYLELAGVMSPANAAVLLGAAMLVISAAGVSIVRGMF